MGWTRDLHQIFLRGAAELRATDIRWSGVESLIFNPVVPGLPNDLECRTRPERRDMRKIAAIVAGPVEFSLSSFFLV